MKDEGGMMKKEERRNEKADISARLLVTNY
jgi:hypothetical protein